MAYLTEFDWACALEISAKRFQRMYAHYAQVLCKFIKSNKKVPINSFVWNEPR